MRTYTTGLAVLALCFAACSGGSNPDRQADSAQSSVEGELANPLQLEPASLSDCTPVSVLVRWNVEQPEEGTEVDVLVDNTGELFAEGGATGHSETGPWARPGTTFVLRDRTSRVELGRATIGGPACE